jgi:hypothetical protein
MVLGYNTLYASMKSAIFQDICEKLVFFNKHIYGVMFFNVYKEICYCSVTNNIHKNYYKT